MTAQFSHPLASLAAQCLITEMNVHILASLHFLTLLPLSLVSRAYVLPFLLLYGLSHMLSPLEAPEICTPMEEHGYDPVFPIPHRAKGYSQNIH